MVNLYDRVLNEMVGILGYQFVCVFDTATGKLGKLINISARALVHNAVLFDNERRC